LDAGYAPVPAKGKRPGIKNYLAYVDSPPSEDTVAEWTTTRPNHRNTGIVCGNTRVIDLDVDDPDLAAECRGIIAEELEYRGLPCRVGRWPRVAFYARSNEPARGTRRVKFKNGSIELLGKGAHVVVDGIHPDTGKAYHWWHDEALWEVEACRLPVLTPEHEAKILARAAVVLGGHVSAAPSAAAAVTVNRVPVGWRDLGLFPRIRDQGLACETQEDLFARAMELNSALCEVPLGQPDIERMVRWVWEKKCASQLWASGGEARAVVTRSEWGLLDPDASHLLAGLRLSHAAQPGKVFAVASRAMAKSFKMGPPRITRARHRLITLGLLEQVGPTGRKGHPTQYRFSQRALPIK
jgi:hypothetical protein